MPRETPRHRAAFETWYGSDDRNLSAIAREYGVSEGAVRKWRIKYEWDARAGKLDDEAIKRANRDLIKKQAEMLKRHGEIGNLATARAAEYLTNHEIQNAGDAARLLQIGVKVEREAVGLPADTIWSIGKMSDEELLQFIAERAGAASGGVGDSEPARSAPAEAIAPQIE